MNLILDIPPELARKLIKNAADGEVTHEQFVLSVLRSSMVEPELVQPSVQTAALPRRWRATITGTEHVRVMTEAIVLAPDAQQAERTALDIAECDDDELQWMEFDSSAPSDLFVTVVEIFDHE